jgi:coenzyme F420 biosynthesis associated uncharacterized protein
MIDVGLASRLGGSLARRRRVSSGYRPGPMELELTELSRLAQGRVAEEAMLEPPGEPRGRVLDRADWVASAAAGVERLAGPTMARAMAARRPPPAFMATASAKAGAVELGSMLAWLSGRVLGQYDILVGEEASLDEDVISYVGPNIVALEERHGFDPGQFRLWLALHETAHRAQFTGAPWVRSYFLGLIETVLEAVPTGLKPLLDGLTRAASETIQGRSPLAEHGLVGLVASEEQLAALSKLSALMSVLEGHGEVVMDVAAEDLVPDAARFHEVLRRRRDEAGAPSKLIAQLLGIEAKMRQYAEGETFVRALREAGGPRLVRELFDGPESLPSIEELRQPELWLDRAASAV